MHQWVMIPGGYEYCSTCLMPKQQILRTDPCKGKQTMTPELKARIECSREQFLEACCIIGGLEHMLQDNKFIITIGHFSQALESFKKAENIIIELNAENAQLRAKLEVAIEGIGDIGFTFYQPEALNIPQEDYLCRIILAAERKLEQVLELLRAEPTKTEDL